MKKLVVFVMMMMILLMCYNASAFAGPRRVVVENKTVPSVTVENKTVKGGCFCESNPCADARCQAYGGGGNCECYQKFVQTQPQAQATTVRYGNPGQIIKYPNGFYYRVGDDYIPRWCTECNGGPPPIQALPQGATCATGNCGAGGISFPAFNSTPFGLPGTVFGGGCANGSCGTPSARQR